MVCGKHVWYGGTICGSDCTKRLGQRDGHPISPNAISLAIHFTVEKPTDQCGRRSTTSNSSPFAS